LHLVRIPIDAELRDDQFLIFTQAKRGKRSKAFAQADARDGRVPS
jgi:hypothetical protein